MNTQFKNLRYRLFVILLLMIISTSCLMAQPQITWQKCLGGSGEDFAEAFVYTSDGGYALTGYSTSNDGDVSGNHGGQDYWVVKLSAKGSIEWQRSLGGSADDYAYAIIESSNGGYVIAGFSNSNDGDIKLNRGENDYWVIKLDKNGNTEWTKSLGGSGSDFAYSVTESKDGGFVVAGSTESTDGDITSNKGGYDYWVVKLDSMGNILWQKTYGGSGDDWATTITVANDGYLIAGASLSTDGDITLSLGSYDYWVIKLNESGDLQWQKSFGGPGSDYARSVALTKDAGFILSGYVFSDGGDITGFHGDKDMWILKLDSMGIIEWQKNAWRFR